MAFQTPITIKDALINIAQRKWALPAIQRELVWHQDQIARLFDSLMRGYPIGSFLFWRVEPNSIKSDQFYQFMDSYHERRNQHCKVLPVANLEAGLMAVLDGQQKLTAFRAASERQRSGSSPKSRRSESHPLPHTPTSFRLTIR